MSRIELSDYEAGGLEMAIDCDGMITLSKNKAERYRYGYTFQPRVAVLNTDMRLLEKAKELCHDQGQIGKNINRQRPKSKDVYRWDMRRSDMREVLPQLSLARKEEQRLLLIDALEILEERKYKKGDHGMDLLSAISDRMRELNKKGKEVD